MYIAMNRFRVVPGFEEAFENQWKAREGRLAEMPGYIEFHMLKGPKAEDHTLYASHTVWETHGHFVAWTKSEQFRAAHARDTSPQLFEASDILKKHQHKIKIIPLSFDPKYSLILEREYPKNRCFNLLLLVNNIV